VPVTVSITALIQYYCIPRRGSSLRALISMTPYDQLLGQLPVQWSYSEVKKVDFSAGYMGQPRSGVTAEGRVTESTA